VAPDSTDTAADLGAISKAAPACSVSGAVGVDGLSWLFCFISLFVSCDGPTFVHSSAQCPEYRRNYAVLGQCSTSRCSGRGAAGIQQILRLLSYY
jgi:hypothetical protein